MKLWSVPIVIMALATAADCALAVPPPLRLNFQATWSDDSAIAALPLAPAIRAEHFATDICQVISQEARRRGLPEEFFARLIWRESLFDPQAVSPVGALGIAQFMPATARSRGLADPFAPHLALAASAHFLSDLRQRHGNLGLAAAAYNAGSGAVAAWLQGTRRLPSETRNYVRFVTGRSAEDWLETGEVHAIPPLAGDADFATACPKLAARRLSLDPAPPEERERPTVKPERRNLEPERRQPWGVILARGFAESRVRKSLAQLKRRYRSLLGDRDPLVVRQTNPGMGSRKLATAMVGADTQEDAESLCAKLRKRGAVCVVSPTE